LVFIESDDLYRAAVKSELEEEGLSVVDFPSSDSAIAGLRMGTEADLVITSWAPGDSPVTDLLSVMQDEGIYVPVIVWADRSTPVHERFALQYGAADFIEKSRGTQVLAARVRLILASHRRVRTSGDRNRLDCGRLLLEAGRARWDGRDVTLTFGELKIVRLLATQAGANVSFRQIYDASHYRGFVAGRGRDGYRTNVRCAIKRIRAKFKKCDPTWDEIINLNGFGYCWRKGDDGEAQGDALRQRPMEQRATE